MTNNNPLSMEARVRIWTTRKHNGELAFPRCVRAHIKEILMTDMYRLTFDELIKYDIDEVQQ